MTRLYQSDSNNINYCSVGYRSHFAVLLLFIVGQFHGLCRFSKHACSVQYLDVSGLFNKDSQMNFKTFSTEEGHSTFCSNV